MALEVHAKLIDTDKQPVAGVEVRVVAYSGSGRAKTLGESPTDDAGEVTIPTDLAVDGLQPRLGIRYKQGSRWRELSDTVASYKGEVADFGTLVVSLEQPAAVVGSRKLFAMSEASFDKPEPMLAMLGPQAEAMAMDGLTLDKLEGAEAIPALGEIPELPNLGEMPLPQAFEELQNYALEQKAAHQQLLEQYGGLEQSLVEKDHQLVEKAQQVVEIEQALGAKNQLIQGLEQSLVQKDQQLVEIEHALGAKDELIHGLEQNVADTEKSLESKLKQLSEAQKQLKDYGDSAKVVDVVNELGSQVGTASKAIDDSAFDVKLDNVSIHLKGIGTADGSRFGFPTISQLNRVAGAEMSHIDLRFIRDRPTKLPDLPAPPGDEAPRVPKLVGYTEIVARRKLQAAGYAVESSFKAVAKPDEGPSPFGRVVEQFPAAGAEVELGEVVEILIGKPISSE